MWSIVGISDESTECEQCGKVELKSTVHLTMDDGSEIRAGSTCAAKLVGVPSADMRGAMKAYNMRLEIARCNFPDYFRSIMKMSIESYLKKFPDSRRVAEGMYRRFMKREGFTV